jgi:hypothetical protein
MKRMKYYICETRFFPMIKNSWGWVVEDIEYKFDLERNFILFEEIIEFFKSY